MKYLILIFSLFAFLKVYGQNHQIDFKYRFGYSTNNLKAQKYSSVNPSEFRQMRSLFDNGLQLRYKYLIWKRFQLRLSGGIEHSRSLHILPILNGEKTRVLENVYIDKNRTVFHLGVNKQFQLYNNKLLLDLGWGMQKRFYEPLEDRYSIDWRLEDPPYNWMEYKYNVTTWYDPNHSASGIPLGSVNYLSSEISADIYFAITNKWNFNLSFSYSFRHVFFYNYTYDVRYYQNGSSTPDATYSFLGIYGPNNVAFGVKDNYLYLGAGVSYLFKFNNREIN